MTNDVMVGMGWATHLHTHAKDGWPMSAIGFPAVDRRAFLVGSASIAAATSLPRGVARAATPAREFALSAAPGRVSLAGSPHPDTDVWCYGGRVPGPEIRVRQGERV